MRSASTKTSTTPDHSREAISSKPKSTGRGRANGKRHHPEREQQETSSSEDSPPPRIIASDQSRAVVVNNVLFPDADTVLILPIAEQVKTMASRFDKARSREIQAHVCSLGYSLGNSVRIPTTGLVKKGKKKISTNDRKRAKRDVADYEEDDDDPAESRQSDGKKIQRIYEAFGEGGIRIDAFLRMLCVALVTKQKLFSTSVRR